MYEIYDFYNMKINKFEDIKSWQLAKEITKKVYLIKCKTDYGIDIGYMDQIRRASISIMSNIAEGFERNTDKDFIKYLYISKASAGEVRSLLHIGFDLDYINKENYEHLLNKIIEISKLISGFIISLTK